MTTVLLEDRATLQLGGPDSRTLLQGLITNTVEAIAPDTWVYAGLLTPQGKYLFDFFITETAAGTLLVDCAASHRADLKRKLMMYRLRAKVEISDGDQSIYAQFGDGGLAGSFLDPRHPALGRRTAAEGGQTTDGTRDDYDAHRLSLGIPDGLQDFIQDKTLWLETNADLLAGVDFKKGCYVGQELTARMHYRGKVRRRLVPIRFAGAIPNGTAIQHNGRDLGDVRSSSNGLGIANLKVEDLHKTPLTAGEVEIAPWVPDWLGPVVTAANEPA